MQHEIRGFMKLVAFVGQLPSKAVSLYSKTNVMDFLLNLLIIKGLYMFRALFAHPQEVLNKRHLVYFLRVMSVGCYQVWSGNPHNTHAIYQVPFVQNLQRMSK
jgi:hypothetical protein